MAKHKVSIYWVSHHEVEYDSEDPSDLGEALNVAGHGDYRLWAQITGELKGYADNVSRYVWVDKEVPEADGSPEADLSVFDITLEGEMRPVRSWDMPVEMRGMAQGWAEAQD